MDFIATEEVDRVLKGTEVFKRMVNGEQFLAVGYTNVYRINNNKLQFRERSQKEWNDSDQDWNWVLEGTWKVYEELNKTLWEKRIHTAGIGWDKLLISDVKATIKETIEEIANMYGSELVKEAVTKAFEIKMGKELVE
jgi:hypothetical protein